MFKIITAAAAAALLAAPAFADHPYAKGEEASNGVAGVAVKDGTLHPGHVSVYATGKGDPSEGKYNKPAAEYHDGDPYEAGPGGWAKTRGDK